MGSDADLARGDEIRGDEGAAALGQPSISENIDNSSALFAAHRALWTCIGVLEGGGDLSC
jgi:hypothetical protein